VAKEKYYHWSALQRELMIMASQKSGPTNEWLQAQHPFYPRYKDTLKEIPVCLDRHLLFLIEANGSIEALDLFMSDQNYLRDVKWEPVQHPETQLEMMFLQWLSQVPFANVTNIRHMVGQPKSWTQTCHVDQLHLCQDGTKEEVCRVYQLNLKAGNSKLQKELRLHSEHMHP